MAKRGHISPSTQLVLEHHRRGLNVTQIATVTGVKRQVIYSALSRHGLEPHGKLVYDWNEIQHFYDAGNSMRACSRHFGITMLSLVKAVRRKSLKTRSQSEAQLLGIKLGTIKRPVMTDETRKKMSDRAKERGLGGETNYYKYQYRGINMDSQWEVDIATWMDKHGISWERDRKFVFPWTDTNGEPHRYYPDFHLPDFDVYLDPKNKYLIEKDRFKIEAVQRENGIRIVWGLRETIIAFLESLSTS